jgi:short chain dehydrogenase
MNVAIKPENVGTGQTLVGKLSLVTGSTSGIGLGIARALAAAGSDIVLNGFGKPDDVAQAQTKIAADFKVRASYSPADMSKPQAIREMIENTLQSSGRLDILVNNAGIQHLAALQEFPPKSGTRSSPSTCRPPSTRPGSPCPRCSRTNGVASSTSRRHTGWWDRRSNPPTLPRSTASSA